VEVELVDIDDIRPYAGNPREIPESAVEAVARSIEAFGFRVPMLVDKDGVLVAGHTRLRAARKLGMAQVPAIRVDDLTPEQIRALRIADNATGDIATWDYNLLPLELRDLQAVDFDLALLGFDADELAKILDPDGTQGLTDPDEAPAPPDEATTRPGDLYILGDHRLLCGDSGKAEDVDRLLDGATIHLANCDPPYGVSVEPRSGNAIAAGLSSFAGPTHHQQMDVALGKSTKATTRKMRPKDRPLVGDFLGDEEFARVLRLWFGNIGRVLEPGRSFYLWAGYSNLANYAPALAESGLYFSQCVVWDKGWPVLTRKDLMSTCELAFYGWREGAAHRFFGPTNATDLWHIKKDNPQSYVHLTQKPVELAVRSIQYSSLPGENVLDLFGGSGSTLIAAEQTGRRAFLMEIDPLYADVIVERWQEFTGRKAERVPITKRTEVIA